MNFQFVIYSLSRIIGMLSLAMLPPLLLSYLYHEPIHTHFIIPIALSLIIGLISFRKNEKVKRLSLKESIVVVVFAWIFVSIIGAIPFILDHVLTSFTDAFFETISGLTATGSTVLTDIESVPKSLLFWRSETHWIGGMGIIVLVIAIFPSLRGSNLMFQSEAPIPPTEDKLLPRVSEVARTYWKIYVLLTAIEILLLLPAMGIFDSITHAFATIAGGGFSTKNLSIGHFKSLYVESVVMIFMVAGATSFILHYYALQGKPKCYLKNTSFKIFMIIIIVSSLFIALNLTLSQNNSPKIFSSIRTSLFQVISLITTTGFTTTDFKQWPAFSQLLLLLLMFIGGMSASTSGSIKVSRYEILFKDLWLRIKTILHPRAVSTIMVGKKSLQKEVILKVQIFFFAYVSIAFIAGLTLTALGNTPSTSFSAVFATLGNVGPGIGEVGPFNNFAHFSITGKLILSACMLIGRLEIWSIFVLFLPEFWAVL